MRRQLRRKRYNPVISLAAAVVLLTGMGVVAYTSMSTASTTVIPAGFFTVADVSGANDVPSQSDMTQMGRDDSDSALYKLFWSWDSTDSWTGTGQTGDACALFDYNGNGNVDAVVCGQVHNPNASTASVVQNHAPYVFRCSDAKNDRCAQPSAALTYGTTDLSAGPIGAVTGTGSTTPFNTNNLITDTDPFDSSVVNGPGSNYPNDSTLQVNVKKTYLNGLSAAKYPVITDAAPTLVNVCSYPSAGNGGNNNPFDCIVAPGSGFLVITKNSGSSPTTWAFGVGPTSALSLNEPSSYNVTTAVPTGGGTATGSSASIGLTIGTDRTVTETSQTGWTLSSASCSYTDGAGTAHATGTRSGFVMSSVAIQSGRITTCTFNNSRDTGSILIQKNTRAGTALAGASFTAQLGTAAAVSIPAVGGTHTGLFCLDGLPTGGSYAIVETPPTGYAGDTNIANVTVSSASTCATRVANSDTPDRTVLNDRLLGSIIVKKVKTGGTALAGAAFSLTPVGGGTAVAMTEGATGIFCADGLPTSTTYSVSETTVPSGYATETILDVTVGSSASTCAVRLLTTYTVDRTVTNTRLLGSIIVKKTTSTGTALGGAAFSLTPVGGGSAITMTEGNTGIFCADGLPTGTEYTVAETTVPAGYNGATSIPNVTVAATASTCAGRLATAFTADSTVENAAAPGRINITKTDDRGIALGGAVFTLFHNTAPLASFDPATDTVTEGTPQTTSAGGAASFTNVPLGEYCVVETTTPGGYATAAPQCFAVGLGGTANTGQTIPLTFVNNRTHRVIVIVCHEGTNTLDPSDVTLGTGAGSTKTSLAAGTLTAAQQATLCATGGATFGSLPHGTVAPSVAIATH